MLVMRRNTIRCDPVDRAALAEGIEELIEAANENGIPREEIAEILERNVEYLDSDAGRERFDGWEELEA